MLVRPKKENRSSLFLIFWTFINYFRKFLDRKKNCFKENSQKDSEYVFQNRILWYREQTDALFSL